MLFVEFKKLINSAIMYALRFVGKAALETFIVMLFNNSKC